MSGHLAHRSGAQNRERDVARLGVPGVGTKLGQNACLECGLGLCVQRIEGHAVLLPGELLQHRHGLAVQPVGRPVRGHQCAVSPDRTELLSADALPGLPAQLDVFPGVDHRTLGIHDALGNGRRLAVDLCALPQQHRECHCQQGAKPQPQFSFGTHLNLSSNRTKNPLQSLHAREYV